MVYFLILVIAALCFYISRLDKKFDKQLAENREKLIAEYEIKLKKNVEKSLDTSRRVLKGQIHEQLAHFYRDFLLNPLIVLFLVNQLI